MKLLIIRHGKAFGADPQRWANDSERPLTRKGQSRFAESVTTIKGLVKDPPRVISSPYERALRTAQILCERAGWGEPEIDERLSAHFGYDDALDLLKSLDETGTYAIVGHDPTFSFLPGYLIGAIRPGATALKPGAVALVDTGTAPATHSSGTLMALIQPRSLVR